MSKYVGLQEIDDTYERLKELGREIGQLVFEPFVGAYYIDRRGYKEQIFKQHCQTLVRNHYIWAARLMLAQWDSGGTFGPGVLIFKKTNTVAYYDSVYTLYAGGEVWPWGGYYKEAEISYAGILIGRGSDAESPESYNLAIPITHGAGANQMMYGATARSKGWNAGSKYYWAKYTRVMTNGSGGSITVTESGLVYHHYVASVYILTMRDFDAWGAGQAVANGESMQVDYELRVYFP